MEQNAEILRRRLARNSGYLRAGVVGALAIRYLRQIAEDEEALCGFSEQPHPDRPGT